jgi:hypothetical protein
MQKGQMTFEAAGGPHAYFGSPAEASAGEGHQIIDRLGAIVEDAIVEILGGEA